MDSAFEAKQVLICEVRREVGQRRATWATSCDRQVQRADAAHLSEVYHIPVDRACRPKASV
jgi:hypothetical protein